MGLSQTAPHNRKEDVATSDPAVAAHPWLERATTYCLSAIEALDDAPFAYVLAFSLRFLDAVHEKRPEADRLLHKRGGYVPADGLIRVTGGADGEVLHALDVAPRPDRPIRTLFAAEVIATDLQRLAGQQQEDGGWIVDFRSASPAGSLDWRGYATVGAIDILRANATV